MKKSKKGFTLVELIIVIAVMAILVAIAIPTIASVTNTARENTFNTNAATIESSLKTFKSLCDSGVADDEDRVYEWNNDGSTFIEYINTQGLDIDDPENPFYVIIENLNVLEYDEAPEGDEDTYWEIVFTDGEAAIA